MEGNNVDMVSELSAVADTCSADAGAITAVGIPPRTPLVVSHYRDLHTHGSWCIREALSYVEKA